MLLTGRGGITTWGKHEREIDVLVVGAGWVGQPPGTILRARAEPFDAVEIDLAALWTFLPPPPSDEP